MANWAGERRHDRTNCARSAITDLLQARRQVSAAPAEPARGSDPAVASLCRLGGFNRYLRREWPNATHCSSTIELGDPDPQGRVSARWRPGFRADAKGWYPTSAFSVPMSIFTVRELEFLASLRTGWAALYCNELARLLKEGDGRCRPRASSGSQQSRVSCDVTPAASVYQIGRPLRGT
jgi:hypothetical protein